MYADDTNSTVIANDIADLKSKLDAELIRLNRWLQANKLGFNITKIGSRNLMNNHGTTIPPLYVGSIN